MTDSTETTDFSLVLASSVHDMKNSLGMLLNSLEEVIGEAPPGNDRQARQFATLQYEASRINTELIQLLALYRLQENRLPVQVDEHYLVDILEEQVARNHMLLQTRGLEIRLDCDEALLWYFDADLVGSVVHNLLVNAARYSRRRLYLGACQEGDQLLLTIADDGCGYPQSMLCGDWSSSDSGVDFVAGNTHLGLYFAHRVAGLHRREGVCGRIQLSNGGPLGGGVFKLWLP